MIASGTFVYKRQKDKNKCPHRRCRVVFRTFPRQEITEGAKDPLTEKFLAESFLELIRRTRIAFHIAFT